MLKKVTSKIFYSIFFYLSGIKHDSTISNFGIYSDKVIRSICSMKEELRVFSTMIDWVGFNTVSIKIKHNARYEGKSNYNLNKLLSLAMDISLAYSDKPLKIIIITGFIVSIMSFFAALIHVIRYLGGDIVSGFTSIIVTLFIILGIIMFTLGIVGLYIGKIFSGIKNRPAYLVKETFN